MSTGGRPTTTGQVATTVIGSVTTVTTIGAAVSTIGTGGAGVASTTPTGVSIIAG